jgi:hypothetical protein
MADRSEDHVATIGSLNSNFGLVGRTWLNWRPGGTLRWKVKTVGWEGQGVVRESLHFQGCSPHLSRLRTNGLAP